jgi:hypothetical protein
MHTPQLAAGVIYSLYPKAVPVTITYHLSSNDSIPVIVVCPVSLDFFVCGSDIVVDAFTINIIHPPDVAYYAGSTQISHVHKLFLSIYSCE